MGDSLLVFLWWKKKVRQPLFYLQEINLCVSQFTLAEYPIHQEFDHSELAYLMCSYFLILVLQLGSIFKKCKYGWFFRFLAFALLSEYFLMRLQLEYASFEMNCYILHLFIAMMSQFFYLQRP